MAVVRAFVNMLEGLPHSTVLPTVTFLENTFKKKLAMLGLYQPFMVELGMVYNCLALGWFISKTPNYSNTSLPRTRKVGMK